MLIVAALLIIAMSVSGQCMQQLGQQAAAEPEKQIAFTIAGSEVTAGRVGEMVEQSLRSTDQGQTANTSLRNRARTTSSAIQGLIRNAAIQSIARQRGVKLDAANAEKAVEAELKAQLQQSRMMATMTGQLKQDATDAEFEALFKEEAGVTPAEAIATEVKRWRESFDKATQEEKDRQLQALVVPMTVNFMASQIKISDEELKKGFDTFTVRTLSFADPAQSLEERKKKAEEARADLAKGTKIEDVAKKMSIPSTALAPFPVKRSDGAANKAIAPVFETKAGQPAPVLEIGGTPTVVFVDKIESKVPADFEKTKEKLRTDQAQMRANAELNDLVEKTISGEQIKWGGEGFRLLYELAKTDSPDMITNIEGRKSALKKIYDKVQTLKTTAAGKPGSQYFDLIEFAAFDNYFAMLTPDQQKPERDRWIEVTQNALLTYEDASLRLELQSQLFLADRKEEGLNELQEAITVADPADPMAQGLISTIQSKLLEIEKDKSITAEMKKPVLDALQEYRTRLQTYEKDQAELRAEQEKIAKEEEAERKRLEEEDRRLQQQRQQAGNAPAANAPAANAPTSNAPAGNTR